MGTYKAKCDICYTENEVPTYGDWDCSKCHQPYEYDEGHRIHLTDAQLGWLRQQRITDAERTCLGYAIRKMDAEYAAGPAGVLKELLERLS